MSSPLYALIVDDEEELAELYRQFIASMGFVAISFTRPLIALEHYQKNPYKYSLVVTDLRMPGINGIELANKMRILNSSVKIFLITAFDVLDLEKDLAFMSAKFSKILQKPIKLVTLKTIIEENIPSI
ncbi:response regulator [Candidatus Nitrosocosmicus hydrocola]|uniref:response regulator n=1 Tax=Candidatus Nitrosocosmicus hydrocola TaxID=1826872 RepID=UPI0011E59B6E|nr:response regulator [Candidatus Nitrosocosmicus hydrocola]